MPGPLIPLLAAGLPMLGGLADSLLSQRTARKNTEMTIAANKREAELAYQRQVEMWHMQNAYNSPVEQMKRFGAAGLNPHLIYGQGNPGNASSTPSYHPPQMQYKFASPTYGAAVSSVLPTLMAVGSWMQNFRKGEIEIAKEEALVDFLLAKNPRELARLDNLLSVAPYQASIIEAKQATAWEAYDMLQRENRHRFDTGGIRVLERAKAAADLRLKTLQADYYEPAMIMKMVGGGVAALAGAAGLGRLMSTTKGSIRQGRNIPKTVKTFYDSKSGRRRSQVVDY